MMHHWEGLSARVAKCEREVHRPCCRYKASGRIVAPEVQQVPDMEVSDEEVNRLGLTSMSPCV